MLKLKSKSHVLCKHFGRTSSNRNGCPRKIVSIITSTLRSSHCVFPFHCISPPPSVAKVIHHRYIRLSTNTRPLTGPYTWLQPLCATYQSPSIYVRGLRRCCTGRLNIWRLVFTKIPHYRLACAPRGQRKCPGEPAQYDPIWGAQSQYGARHRGVCGSVEGACQREYVIGRLLVHLHKWYFPSRSIVLFQHMKPLREFGYPVYLRFLHSYGKHWVLSFGVSRYNKKVEPCLYGNGISGRAYRYSTPTNYIRARALPIQSGSTSTIVCREYVPN